jgi:NAD(P)-dependent dehydrogenase (short-subunit alcohol dehydrogenase family)
MAASFNRAKAAIVTGAAQGIGKAIALRLARDGFNIALNDLPRELPRLEQVRKAIQEHKREAIIEAGDISQEGTVKKLVERCVESFGGLDVMVANAGMCPTGPFLESMTCFLSVHLCIHAEYFS